jgi:hypothetical protein
MDDWRAFARPSNLCQPVKIDFTTTNPRLLYIRGSA